jgi:hypothetical protein
LLQNEPQPQSGPAQVLFKRLILPLLFSVCGFAASAQQFSPSMLINIKELTVIIKEHPQFKSFFEVTVRQPVDHFDTASGFFDQRLLIGINDVSSPTIVITEGYTLMPVNCPDYI